VLWLDLEHEKFEGDAVYARLEGQVGHLAQDVHFAASRLVSKCLAVVLLKLLKPVVGLNVSLLFDDIGDSLLNFFPFLFI